MVASSTPHVEIALAPDFGPRNRATVIFRAVLLIPVAILASLLAGGSLFSWNEGRGMEDTSGTGGGAILVAVALIIIFVGRYPQWVLTFVHGLQAFQLRIAAYVLLLRDEYPSVDHRDYAALLYPEIEGGARLNRLMPIVKWFLAIPHYLWLIITGFGVLAVTILAWFAIIFTGRYPRSFADFVVGWLAYYNRVVGYAFALVSDTYPPFTLR